MNPFVDLDGSQRRIAAALLIPAILLFGLGSALEVFHPVEEPVLDAGQFHEFDEDRKAIHAHDAPAFAHDHHFCPHSNALAHLAPLRAAFGTIGVFVPVAVEPADRPASAVLAVLDRGPPSLL